jgi:hypothetical protein
MVNCVVRAGLKDSVMSSSSRVSVARGSPWMAGPSSRREVQLVHAQAPGRPLIRAELSRDFPPVLLENLESQWQEGRERAATEGMAEGLAPLELQFRRKTPGPQEDVGRRRRRRRPFPACFPSFSRSASPGASCAVCTRCLAPISTNLTFFQFFSGRRPNFRRYL